MEGAGDSYNDLMQRLQSSVGASSSSTMVRNPKSPQQQQQQGIPRSHSFSPHQGLPPMPTRSMPTHPSTIPSPSSSHSRSASQPSSFFSPKLPFPPSLATPLPQGVRHSFPTLNPATTTNAFGAKRDPSSPPSVVDTLMAEDEISHPPPSISSASSLPPLSPSMSAYRRSGFDPPTHPMESHPPPAKRGHRRAYSDIPISFSAGAMSPPADNRFFPFVSHGSSAREVAEMTTEGGVSSGGPVKKELDWGLCEDDRGGDDIGMKGLPTCEREEADDDLFSMYIDLEKINGGSIDVMESFDKAQIGRGGGGEEGGKKMGNEAWGMASSDRSQSMSSIRVDSLQEGGSDSSDEGESDENDRLLTGGAGLKKMIGGEIRSLHSRSASVESALRIIDGSPPPPTGPLSCQSRRGRHGHSLSMDGGSAGLKLELLSVGEFDAAEMKKITASDKLIEIALADPRRAKRILANRQSAARSKERKMRYISELERKVQTLQSEATTLSAQLTHLQRDSTGLINENSELKLRLQVTEQQAQLRDALNEALREEIQRLKLVTGQVPNHQMVFNNQHSNFQMPPPSQGGGSHNIPSQRFQPPMGSPQQDLTPNSFDPSFPTLKNSVGNSEGKTGTSSC